VVLLSIDRKAEDWQLKIIKTISTLIGKDLDNITDASKTKSNYYTEIKNEVLALNIGNLELKQIPNEIAELTELNLLVVSGNLLLNVSDFIVNLKKLAILDLSQNQISIIPDWIGKLQFLRELHLNNNQLYSLPSTIGKLTLLRKLYLQSNNIHRLPFEILDLKLLEEIHIDFRSTIRKSTKAVISNLESMGCIIYNDYNRR